VAIVALLLPHVVTDARAKVLPQEQQQLEQPQAQVREKAQVVAGVRFPPLPEKATEAVQKAATESLLREVAESVTKTTLCNLRVR
jgi:hypothetical protein